MKFFQILALAAFASAAPTIQDVQARSLESEERSLSVEERDAGIEQTFADLEARQNNGGGVSVVIVSAVATLVRTSSTNIDAIRGAIEQSKGNVDARVLVQIQGIIRANFAGIASAFRTAGQTILRATAGGGSDLANAVRGLSREQLTNLVNALTDVVRISNSFAAMLNASLRGASAPIRTLVTAELAALRTSIQPFLTPLQAFIGQITNIRDNDNDQGVVDQVNGLGRLIADLGRILLGLVDGVGLGLGIGEVRPPQTGQPGGGQQGGGLGLGLGVNVGANVNAGAGQQQQQGGTRTGLAGLLQGVGQGVNNLVGGL